MKRQQVNVRLSEDAMATLDALVDLLREQHSNPDLNASDVVRIALVELDRRLRPKSSADDGSPPAVSSKAAGEKKGRKRGKQG